MSQNETNTQEITLPLLPLRGIVGFPAVQMNIEIARPSSLKAFTAAASSISNARVLLATQKDISVEAPREEDLYKIGVLAEIKHVVRTPQGTLNVIFEGISRVKILAVYENQGFLKADAVLKPESKPSQSTPTIEALVHEINHHLTTLKDIHPNFTEDMRLAAEAITNPSYLADFVASAAVIDYKNKQSVLEAFNTKTRLEKLLIALEEEALLLECEHSIQMQVREKIDRNQKDYFLREQIKAIQSELGEDDDDEIKDYDNKIAKANLPKEIEEKLYKELNKLSKTPFGAAEGDRKSVV